MPLDTNKQEEHDVQNGIMFIQDPPTNNTLFLNIPPIRLINQY